MPVRRTNPTGLAVLTKRIASLDSKVGKSGWFKSAVYEDGTSVAYVASIQEFGATINHPGGTPYKIGPGGQAVFVAKDAPGAANLPVTKPHIIVIPPRPFMRPTVAQHQREWIELQRSGAKAILHGNSTPQQVMEAQVQLAAGQVAKTISEITDPPLAASTIAARRRQLSDKKTIGSLDKSLVHTGMMIDTVTGIVEDKGNDSGQ